MHYLQPPVLNVGSTNHDLDHNTNPQAKYMSEPAMENLLWDDGQSKEGQQHTNPSGML